MRTINEVAIDIKKEWAKPHFSAVPYLDAMLSLRYKTDFYYLDSAYDIVSRFLANAATFKGERARWLKAELKTIMQD